MSGWQNQEFRERLRAVVRDYIERKARHCRDTHPADDVNAGEKGIVFPRPPRLPMHR